MIKDKKRSRVIFIQELKTPFNIKNYGKVIAFGKVGMFLCRNHFGHTWFETFESLQIYYKFVTIRCGIFAVTNVCIKKQRKKFSLKSSNGFIFNGGKNDEIVTYPSGVCYVVRRYSQGERVIFPIHLIGSENPKVNF